MQCKQRIFGILPANNLNHYMNLNITMLLLFIAHNIFFHFIVCVEMFTTINKWFVYIVKLVKYGIVYCWSWFVANLYNLLRLNSQRLVVTYFFLLFFLICTHARSILQEQIAKRRKEEKRNSTRAKLLTQSFRSLVIWVYICFALIYGRKSCSHSQYTKTHRGIPLTRILFFFEFVVVAVVSLARIQSIAIQFDADKRSKGRIEWVQKKESEITYYYEHIEQEQRNTKKVPFSHFVFFCSLSRSRFLSLSLSFPLAYKSYILFCC